MFAVSSGEYSYYQVHCLFESRVLAEKHAAKINKKDRRARAFVEEFQVFDRAPKRVTWYFDTHRLYEDGAWPPKEREPIKCVGWEYEVPPGLSDRPQIELKRWMENTYPNGYTSGSVEEGSKVGVYGLNVSGLNRKNVGKATSEVIAQWRAQGYRLHNATPEDD